MDGRNFGTSDAQCFQLNARFVAIDVGSKLKNDGGAPHLLAWVLNDLSCRHQCLDTGSECS